VRGSRDTSVRAREAQLAIFRSLEPAARLGMASTMSDEARAIAEAGMRHRHPAWPSDRVASAVRDLMIGEELARRLGSHLAPARR
jgi:hypothetical protein